LGLGTVGTGVVRIVEGHHDDLERQIGAPVEISRIAVRNADKPRAVRVDRHKLTENPWEVVNDPEIDVIIEVMGGVEHTKTYLLAALEQGKQVVTANKDLMALHGPDILAKAAEVRRDVMYEASVAGGIPILRTITEGFASDRIRKIVGIVNGTTNYILTKMSREGADYADVLREAQQLGYAEADPTSDVEGYDAAYKMTILASLGFRTHVSVSDVDVRGISKVTAEDIIYGKRLGYEMKLLGIAERDEDLISVSVQPTFVRASHPLASVSGVFNAVYVYGEASGETMFYGPGAGELPTAVSVTADLVAAARNLLHGFSGRSRFAAYNPKRLKSDEQIRSKYFILLRVDDKAGVLAKIAHVFGECDVSLDSVLQQPNPAIPDAEIIIITHDASKASVNRVLTRLGGLDTVKQIRSVYRVEG
jgi:homoserine dehydrogenase